MSIDITRDGRGGGHALFVKRDIEQIFTYRVQWLRELFGTD